MHGMVDWAGRMKQMAEFVGLTQTDLGLIQSTAAVLVPHAEALTAAIYDHFLLFPETRKFFLREDGEVEQDRIARRKTHPDTLAGEHHPAPDRWGSAGVSPDRRLGPQPSP